MTNYIKLLLIFSFITYSLIGSTQTYKYLGGWDSLGVPNYLCPINDIVSKTTLDNLKAVLPERVENLTYVDNNNLLNIKLDTATKIWISIISEGASLKNTLAFYSYDTGHCPASISNIDTFTILFPNVSIESKILNSGNKVCLGDTFSAGTEIAFSLFQSSYKTNTISSTLPGTIKENGTKFFTNFHLNPEYNNAPSLSPHNVVFWDNSVKKYVLGFEDLDRRYGSDDDFNDCLFYITMDPLPPFAREDNPNPPASPPVLPVDLINFEATYSNSNIILNWVTASEYNNEGFEIQRSDDNLNFETIGFEKGNGYANVLIRYTFVDTDIEAGKTYYYRLKQIDYDGQFKYSSIQTAQIAPTKLMLSAYPNPVGNGDKINFKLSSDDKGGNGTINFYSIDGQLIFNKDINYFGLKYYDQIDTKGLKSGMYILEFRNNFQTIQNKIIVK